MIKKNPFKAYLEANNLTAYKVTKVVPSELCATIYRLATLKYPSELSRKKIEVIAMLKCKTGVDMFEWYVEYLKDQEK